MVHPLYDPTRRSVTARGGNAYRLPKSPPPAVSTARRQRQSVRPANPPSHHGTARTRKGERRRRKRTLPHRSSKAVGRSVNAPKAHQPTGPMAASQTLPCTLRLHAVSRRIRVSMAPSGPRPCARVRMLLRSLPCRCARFNGPFWAEAVRTYIAPRILYIKKFQWPLLGRGRAHAQWERDRASNCTFQWPLLGRGRAHGRERSRNLRSDRFNGPFWAEAVRTQPIRFDNKCYTVVSMAPSGPRPCAQGRVGGGGVGAGGFQWPLLGRGRAHPGGTLREIAESAGFNGPFWAEAVRTAPGYKILHRTGLRTCFACPPRGLLAHAVCALPS